MKLCKNCGLKLNDNQTQCPRCGNTNLVLVQPQQNGQQRPISNNTARNNTNRANGQPVQNRTSNTPGQNMQNTKVQPRPTNSGQNINGQRPTSNQQKTSGMQQRPGVNINKKHVNQNLNSANPWDEEQPWNEGISNTANINNNIKEETNPWDYQEDNINTKEVKKESKKENNFDVEIDPTKAPIVTVGEFIKTWFILLVPILNLIYIIKVLVSKNNEQYNLNNPDKMPKKVYNANIRNYIIAFLITTVISTIITTIAMVVLNQAIIEAFMAAI